MRNAVVCSLLVCGVTVAGSSLARSVPWIRGSLGVADVGMDSTGCLSMVGVQLRVGSSVLIAVPGESPGFCRARIVAELPHACRENRGVMTEGIAPDSVYSYELRIRGRTHADGLGVATAVA